MVGDVENTNICFVIMPIGELPNYPDFHFRHVYEDIFVPAIKAAGFIPRRADDRKASSLIQADIVYDIVKAPMALCDLSTRNPNVLFELGLRQAYDLPVVLVQEKDTPRIFDISGINTIDYRRNLIFREVIEDREKICNAIEATSGSQGINSITKLLSIEKAIKREYEEVGPDEEIKYLLKGIKNDLANFNKSFTKVRLGGFSNLFKISYQFERPKKSIDEMVEISEWVREKYQNKVYMQFDDLAVNIDIIKCNENDALVIIDEIKCVLFA